MPTFCDCCRYYCLQLKITGKNRPSPELPFPTSSSSSVAASGGRLTTESSRSLLKLWLWYYDRSLGP